jgi:type I restriction enzyme M protein
MGLGSVNRPTSVADADELKQNDYNLNIPLYVVKVIEDKRPTAGEAMSNSRRLGKRV